MFLCKAGVTCRDQLQSVGSETTTKRETGTAQGEGVTALTEIMGFLFKQANSLLLFMQLSLRKSITWVYKMYFCVRDTTSSLVITIISGFGDGKNKKKAPFSQFPHPLIFIFSQNSQSRFGQCSCLPFPWLRPLCSVTS